MKTEPASKNEYKRQKTGRLIPCTGEAHSNPYIDNCMVCMPRWGQVDEYLPVDLAKARTDGQDVRLMDCSEEQMAEIRAAEKRGECTTLMVTRTKRRSSSSYFVVRWTPGKETE